MLSVDTPIRKWEIFLCREGVALLITVLHARQCATSISFDLFWPPHRRRLGLLLEEQNLLRVWWRQAKDRASTHCPYTTFMVVWVVGGASTMFA
jgi:hypothetical protein